MIDQVYRTVLAIVNKEQRGSITPEKFNLLANQAVNKRYNEYEIDTYINQSNKGFLSQGINDLVKNERERYQHYLKEDTMTINGNTYPLPTDSNFIDIITADDVELQECTSSREFNTLKRAKNLGASSYPVYFKIANNIKVYPDTLPSALGVTYIRKPIPCKWTYTIVNNAPLYNPSAGDFSDIDMHESEMPNIVIEILALEGIYLKERDLIEYAELLKAKEVQKDITN